MPKRVSRLRLATSDGQRRHLDAFLRGLEHFGIHQCRDERQIRGQPIELSNDQLCVRSGIPQQTQRPPLGAVQRQAGRSGGTCPRRSRPSAHSRQAAYSVGRSCLVTPRQGADEFRDQPGEGGARCHTCYRPPVVALRQRTGLPAAVGECGAGSAAGFIVV